MTTKRTNQPSAKTIAKRAARAARTAEPTTAVAVAEPTTTTTTTAVDVPSIDAPLTFAAIGVELPDTFRVPACIAAYVTGFRAIAGMPVATTDERIAASRAFTSAAFPNDEFSAANGTANVARSDIGTGIMDTQNAVYYAVVLANVDLHVGHVSAAWASIFPNARCGRKNPDARGVPYVSAKTFDYAFTGTLSAYVNANNGHGGHGGFHGIAIRTIVATMLRANIRNGWYRAPRPATNG